MPPRGQDGGRADLISISQIYRNDHIYQKRMSSLESLRILDSLVKVSTGDTAPTE